MSIRRRTPLRKSSGAQRDPVSADVALRVLARDSGCVAVRLGEPPADCRGRLTLDRPELREYLRTANVNPHDAHVDPCGPTCREAVA